MTRRMLAWVVYPATMTGAFGVHAALQSAGVPILAAARAVSTPLRQPDSAFTVAPQAGDERGRAIVTDGL